MASLLWEGGKEGNEGTITPCPTTVTYDQLLAFVARR